MLFNIHTHTSQCAVVHSLHENNHRGRFLSSLGRDWGTKGFSRSLEQTKPFALLSTAHWHTMDFHLEEGSMTRWDGRYPLDLSLGYYAALRLCRRRAISLSRFIPSLGFRVRVRVEVGGWMGRSATRLDGTSDQKTLGLVTSLQNM